VPFDEVVEVALYHPEVGFYEGGGGAGRGGADFLTSPEVGPLFGEVVAAALDGWWQELGRPDPFVVAEAGAGTGTLAAAVLAARPVCSPALRYLLVERSEALRRRQAERVPLEPAPMVLGPALADDPDLGLLPAPGTGPLAAALAELPAGPFEGVVLANELLDNLPFRLLQRLRGPGSWAEVRVDENLAEVLVPAAPDLCAEAQRLAPDAVEGGRIPRQAATATWLRRALASLSRGRLVAIDYADTTPSMAARPWRQWVRTYRGHALGGPPLEALGGQDITCELAIDQLATVRMPERDRSQAEFLSHWGLDRLAGTANRQWEERAHLGDLQAVKARSRVHEAASLTDPTGLGAFRVLEWSV